MDSQIDAVSVGRRVYLGTCNLLYVAKPYDIEDALVNNGFGDFEKINISIDLSAQNPGYCFIDFRDHETADRAIASLRATIRGRPVKVGPCEPIKQGNGGKNRDVGEDQFAFRRWGDWDSKSADAKVPASRLDSKGAEHGPYRALNHFADLAQDFKGRRLFVGRLGKMFDQAQCLQRNK